MKKLILHIPHSSSVIPFDSGFIVDKEIIDAEILKLTDWFTDELFYSDSDEMIKADFNRVFCDCERFSDDKVEKMSKYGMGVLYTHTDNGILMRKVPKKIRNYILNKYYFDHHYNLIDAIYEQLILYKKAIIIDCHSFSNIPFIRDLNQNEGRPDFCIGTDLFHTSPELEKMSFDYFNNNGYSVEINSPYSGTIVPDQLYSRKWNIDSIMIEVNRDLYLIENTNLKSDNFNKIKELIQGYLEMVRVEFLL